MSVLDDVLSLLFNHFNLHFIPCIHVCRLLKPAGIGLNELFSSDAIHGFLYGPPVNADKAIHHPGALRKVSTLHFYLKYEPVY